MVSEKLTPMMRQYKDLKAKYPDCLLFFRLGDFYELFFEDAIEVSRLLNLTLTKRQTASMCGIPYHAIDSYLGRLTRIGKKVAICEQLSDPALPGIVKRDVVRVVTPGTTFDERILDQKANRFIVAVVCIKGKFGLAACDATTGLFEVISCASPEMLREEFYLLSPAECVVDGAEKNLPAFLKDFETMPVFPHQCWDNPRELLCTQFGVKSLSAFGIDGLEEVVWAAALITSYLRETQKSPLTHIRPPRLAARGSEMVLDESAIRNLELVISMREARREGSLFSLIDATQTSMGGRMLRSWTLHPLREKDRIEARHEAVAEIIENAAVSENLTTLLASVLDLERLLGRISIGSGNARDVLGIGVSLKCTPPVTALLSNTKSQHFKKMVEHLSQLAALGPLREKILATIVDNPPLSIKEGGLIKRGLNTELDELCSVSTSGKDFIQKLQQREIERTNIQSLKIRFNNIFGYYIEVTKANAHKVPLDYIRKQTTVNGERFITPELKEYEEKVLGAEEKMQQLEYRIFLALREDVIGASRELQTFAAIIGTLDALVSLALVAKRNRFCRPHMCEEGGALAIKNGRHPVVEAIAPGTFVPNDTALDDAKQLILLSGPNMGGKSTYLRQTALIVLMAHMGSFVPADSALIPLTDRIFTRVGANDNLVRGQSTFMVEMQEAAHILHYATKSSLIILDEIGRGTSTYDGVSLAWAILEHIHNDIGAKTLFATHYHELISVVDTLPRAANFSVAVREDGGKIVFLYKILPGAIDRSYGIEVARLAGLPRGVIERAKNILGDLEEGVLDKAVSARALSARKDEHQLGLFQERPHRMIEELKTVDINGLTPLEALQKLDAWKKMEP